MGETRVDLLHLLEDLRDAYPGSLEETILTEIVANVAMSLAPLTVEPAGAHAFITTFLERWGREDKDRPQHGRRGRRSRS